MRQVLRGTGQALLWAVLRVTVGPTPVEMGAVHLLLPWAEARWAVFVLSAVMPLGTVAFALALGQRPHTLDPYRLTLRFGFLREVVVPVADVVAARPRTTLDHRRVLEARCDAPAAVSRR